MGLVKLRPVDIAKVFETHGKITDRQLDKLSIDEDFLSQVDEEVRSEIKQKTTDPKRRQFLAKQLLKALEKKQFHVKKSFGASVCEQLLDDTEIRDVTTFLDGITRHAKKKVILNGVMLMAVAMSFVASVLSTFGGQRLVLLKCFSVNIFCSLAFS